MIKKVLYLVLLAAMIAGMTGCAGSNAAVSNIVLVVRAYGDPQSFIPDNTGDDLAYGINQNIFNRLVKLDASKEIIPDLAEKWELSNDGKVITFHLVKNAKWHDGKPVTSADVKYTFDYIKADATTFFNGLMQKVETIETPDDNTVVFKMTEPNVAMIGYLGWYETFVMPKHVFDNGQKMGRQPRGDETGWIRPVQIRRVQAG
jgi:peptide/nickel transport system substrate-binding protein